MSFSLPIPRPFVRRRRALGPTDEQLLTSWRSGDSTSFNTLFDRYRDRVIGYAWRMVRNHEEAEDIALESFCRVLEGAWRPGGSFRSFLFTVTHRLCIDRLRKRQRTLRFASLWRAAPRITQTPEEAAVNDQRHKALELALADLPDEHRATVLLYYGQEIGSKDVARILGCTDQQVRSRLSYSRKRLRQWLQPQEDVST
ncbi:MAG: RNA polymerase sigma-70 factor (ECF subfamily) [Kiritimatiellia bacterium]|jgi:RNA polymerase sigma-70 factor (ECF subfamily)